MIDKEAVIKFINSMPTNIESVSFENLKDERILIRISDGKYEKISSYSTFLLKQTSIDLSIIIKDDF